ncbi:hypothetical protein QJS10_CPB21g00439 [Acorus calamus]|uniref:acyl-CoA hydrolase n=1 Tax=Acorus calamus TaxID=4465 RepID=A0AAV9C3Q7_ACOCL|nr:hypothetical protein QJS10_CPB21g00439 [Acorus calamus]
MDSEAVIEFLGQVPLLQRLPGISLRKIAEVVKTRHYEPGDYVVRDGERGAGIYFIWEGEAEVSGFTNGEEGNQPEIQLKKYDFFGYGTVIPVHQANVIALSKLTCLVLNHVNSHLLQPTSIWNADDVVETYSLVEHLLRLEPIEVDIFRGVTLPDAPSFGQVFGGQFIAQALAAASKTVDCRKLVHSLHCYFVLVGDISLPIIYQVHRAREGKSFALRRVDAIQRGNVIFTLHASFQKEELGFDHQVEMPQVPSPDTLPTLEELRDRRLTDPRLPPAYRNKVAKRKFVPWPIEIRFCEPNPSLKQYKSEPSLMYWFKAKGKLSDDPALHRCVVAYASDLIFSNVSTYPHREEGVKIASLSLDHAMWFHRPIRADEWLLYVIDGYTASGARGFCKGLMFNRKGELVASLAQESVSRKAKPRNQVLDSKL